MLVIEFLTTKVSAAICMAIVMQSKSLWSEKLSVSRVILPTAW